MTLKICNETIHHGEKLSLALPLPEIFSCAPLYMPIKVYHSKKPGPCLLLTAAMYGNEINGTEIIHRLFESNAFKKISGTIIGVPALNVFGLINRSRFLPGGINLDRCFPGSKTGTHAARMANLFIEEIFAKADVCIDLQSGDNSFINLPQLYVNFKDEQAKSLAQAFNAPVISNAVCEKGMLKTVAFKKKKPFMVYQAGEAMRFDENAIKFAIKGITNVMRKLDMLPDNQTKSNKPTISQFSDSNTMMYAPSSGIVRSKLKLGQRVAQNELLCVIEDPFGVAESIKITAPGDAIVVGKNSLPLIHEGESLFQLAYFNKIEKAMDNLAQWKKNNTQEAK